MIEALVVSNILLWVVCLALAATVLALLRQVGLLNERVAPAGALMPARGPAVGEPAPVVEVEDWNGVRLRVGAAAEDGCRTLLLFVSPTCPVCKTILAIVGSVIVEERASLRLIFASDGPREEHRGFVAGERLLREHPYVLSAPLGLAYQAGKLPYAVLIDGSGIVRARGLVNTREHLESLFEAERRGIGSLQEYLETK